MTLIWLILLPLIGGLLAWLLSRWGAGWARWISLITLLAEAGLVASLWMDFFEEVVPSGGGTWLLTLQVRWIPQLGVSFFLALDGLSLLLVALTVFLGILSVGASWTEITERVGFFHFCLMWVLAAIIGVFLALDLFLFFFLWELMLVPMYLLIAIWGHENRIYAAIKFFLFTQLSGLLMLLAILGLYFLNGGETFNYLKLLQTPMAAPAALLLMLGFFVAFAVKLPVVPLHTWLPDAHTEAPTAGSVILAGLLLKTGAYGLLRFVVPLFPQLAVGPAGTPSTFALVAMALGVAGILYGALLAFGQTDLKRLVAYTSVSHMGFVLLGIFAFNELALQGVMIEMICHGISTGALFILVGQIQQRSHTRDVRQMGGFWELAPRMGGATMLFALASLGLPGLGNFVGEFLVLLGTYQASPVMAILATLGFVVSVVYALWMVQMVFHGPQRAAQRLPDLSGREASMMALMVLAIVGLGVYPAPVLSTFKPALQWLQASAAEAQGGAETGTPNDAPLTPHLRETGGVP